MKTQAREQPRLEKLFYRAREIAIITGLGRTVVYELMSAGDFGPVVKIGDARLVSAAGLMAWAETKIQEAQEALEE